MNDFKEDLGLYRRLFQDNPRKYAGDVARVEADLEKL
jgi:hypothetical protein